MENTLAGCSWAQSNPIMKDYHDNEWCVPNEDDTYLFEMLNLEGAQAGLSWISILKRRDGYRKAFHNFDISSCASMSEEELDTILLTGDVIRHHLKVKAVRTNALAAQKIQKEFGSFSKYIWHFTDFKPTINHWETESQLPAKNELSEHMSKDLKKRGFKFVGPVIIYSYIQAIGLVDDHMITCPCHTENK